MRVGLQRARIRLSRLIGQLAPDDVVLIVRRGEPVARLTRPTERDIGPRGFGCMRGKGTVIDTPLEYWRESDEEVAKLFGL
jgi:antitoxin (DNA-binding transcriptional repressor) of toxin-antitoxin stability system